MNGFKEFSPPYKPHFSRLLLPKPGNRYKVSNVLECEGFDTETKNGYAKIISDSNRYIIVDDINDVLQFLTRNELRDKIKVFFNLKFDVEVMLKWCREILEQLMEFGYAEYDGYKIKNIPGKCFVISREHKSYQYYDIAQFFNCSLKTATRKYLGGEVMENMKVDRGNLFNKYSLEKIGEYCKDDATKTKQLAQFFVDKMRTLGIYTAKLYSCGYLSQWYTINYGHIPPVAGVPMKVLSMYWKAYRGGWFDVHKRGTIKCSNYDLKSAYPWALSQIPDPTYGKWEHKFDPDADAGIMWVKMLPGNFLLNPIAFFSMVNVYPVIDTPCYTYLTLGEYKTLREFMDIKVLDACSFTALENNKPPYLELVNKLFQLKESYKNDIGLYETVKRIINSLYGKTAQSGKSGQQVKGRFRAGRLFNPYFAAECTALCRMKIFNDCVDKVDKIVSIMTDGVLLETPARLSESKGLGGWEKKFENENTIVVQTGVYQTEKGEIRTRGFSVKMPVEEDGVLHFEAMDLHRILDSPKTVIPVWHFRPRHYRECLIQNAFNKVGVFESVMKELDLNGDLKRIWKEPVKQARDLLDKQFDSTPVPVSGL